MDIEAPFGFTLEQTWINSVAIGGIYASVFPC